MTPLLHWDSAYIYVFLKARADAACNTISELIENGLTIEVTDEDREVAATIATAYAKDPEADV
jgi:hypothetical protein